MFSSERNCMVLEGDAQRGPKEAAHFHDRKIQLRPAPSRKAPDRSLLLSSIPRADLEGDPPTQLPESRFM